MLTSKQQRQAARKFVQYWQDKKGYEKGETQKFWNMLLRDIFGVDKPENLIEYEKTVQQVKSHNFIDAYIAQTQVLIEQKSVHIDLLQKAKQSDGSFLTPYEQAKRYGDELPLSQKPRYIIACNFKEFHIHDMEKPNEPPQIVLLKDLVKEFHRLSIIADRYKPAHIQKEEQLSIDAGKIVGELYDALSKQYKDINDPATQQSLNKLCVRLVFCLYAENADLFHQRSAFYDYLQDFSPRETRQALIDLFTVFNTPDAARDKLYLSEECLKFPYINGGLFADQAIEIPQITAEIRNLLLDKASNGFDWAEISPTIFGAVFESTLNPETRRSGGMHYTSIENIYKVIKPLFLDDLIDELEEIKTRKDANTKKRLVANFQNKLASLTFLDPAAGSGNFLTQTYIELRKLENQALAFAYGDQMHLIDPIKVKIGQFYGIEINDFAVSVAQTALWIAEIQMKRQTEEIFTDSQIEYLPLKSFAHFVEGNALRMDWNSVIAADKLNYIMGNPPFVGYSLQDKSQKEDLLATLTDENGKTLKTAGKVDYVAGWYYKACDYMQGTNIQAAFVSTNSICQGEQTAFIFKPLQQRYGIQFNFAYRTFRWDSESNDKAAVHCVIIGFSLNNNNNAAPTVIASEQSERGNPPTTENGSNLSGSLNNNSTAVGWASLPTNNATQTVIASEQSERSNPPTTENGSNLSGSLNNNSTAVGWACQPTNRPDRGEENPMNTNNLSGSLNTTQSTPNGVAVGWEAHPTALPETATVPTTENKPNLSGSLKKQKIIYNGSQQITAKNINAYLFDAPDILVESRRSPICNVPPMILGSIPRDGGHLSNYTPQEKDEIINKYPSAAPLFKPILGAEEYINNKPRYCLWLKDKTPNEYRHIPPIMDAISAVKEMRLQSTRAATRELASVPMLFAEIRQPETQYIIVPSVSSEKRAYVPIGFVSPEIIVNNAVQIIPNATLYMFGVLTSSLHMAWMRAVAGRLEMRYRYSGNIVYNNFIWCEPSEQQRQKIEQTAQAILDARAKFPDSSLADLYDESVMPPNLRAAHTANDQAVLAAYGLPKNTSEEEIVAFLMQEYQKRTGT